MTEASERQPQLLVCIAAAADAEHTVRLGRRRIDGSGGDWVVVTVDTGETLSEANRALLHSALLLADQMGATTVRLHGADVAHELLSFARRERVTELLLSRIYLQGWRHWFGISVAARLLRHGSELSVTIAAKDLQRTQHKSAARSQMTILRHEFLLVSLIMLVTTAAAWAVGNHLSQASTLLIFLVGVLIAALRSSPAPAAWSALLGFLGYTYFFTEPKYTLVMHHYEEMVTAFLLLAIALVSGNLAVRLRRQIQALRETQRSTDTLYKLGLQLMTAPDPQDILQIGARFLHRQFEQAVRILETDANETLQTIIREGEAAGFDDKDYAAAQWAWKNARPAGWSTQTLGRSRWIWQPLLSGQNVLALVGLHRAETEFLSEQHQLLEALLREITLALERSVLARSLESARVQSETEQLRSALLSSVSHDLRTPLSAMIGSVSSLLQYRQQLNDADEKALLESTLNEAERLNRYIQNLLDMTRLGSGNMKLSRDWVALEDVVASATQRLHSVLSRVTLRIKIDSDIPLLYVHAALIEQALINILENAARFSPDNARIEITAKMIHADLEISIGDQGPGIPEDERVKIFDMFYTVKKGDRAGTGLGLAISQGMIGAHSGRIEALAGPHGKGTTIRIVLPLGNQPALPAELDE